MTLERILKSACWATLLFILLTISWHLRGWVRGIDHLMAEAQTAAGSLKEAADTSNLVSTESLNLVGSSVKLVNHATQTVDRLDTAVAHLDATTANIGASVSDLSAQVGKSVQDLDANSAATLTQVSASTTHLNATLDATTATVQQVGIATQRASAAVEAAQQVIAGPVTQSAEHLAKVTDNLQAMSGDTREAVHRMTRPAGWLRTLGERLLGYAADFAQIFK